MVLMVAGSIASLKVAAIFVLIATPVAAFAGSVELTVGGVVASSSRIREYILEGRVGAARALLGRPFDLDGVVVKGDGRGRSIGRGSRVTGYARRGERTEEQARCHPPDATHERKL